jgi:photosystem II stability/assembly factor-like uncharacterized protein
MFKHLISLSLCFSCTVLAQDAIQAKLANESILLDITAPTADSYVVVGERGHVLLGQTLTDSVQVPVPTKATLTAVTHVGERLWAVGHDHSILHSIDAGQTWVSQYEDAGKERPFLDVLFFDELHGVVAGAYGSFMRTRDGGQTWQKELHASLLHPDDIAYLEEIRELDGEEFYLDELSSILPHLNRLSYDGTTLYLAGEAGMLAKSVNAGESWERIDIDYEGSFFDIITAGDKLIAGGLRGNLFIQSQGESWTQVDLCHTSSINSLLLYNEQLTVMSNNGYIATIDYANLDTDPSCNDPQVTVIQNANKVTVMNALPLNNTMIAVTSQGIASLVNQK